MTPFSSRQTIDIGIALLCAVVFALDMVTPLGIAIWVLYLLPVSLCLMYGRAHRPFVIAAVCAALVLAGYFVSPPGLAREIGIANRVLGVLILFAVAYLTSRVITDKQRNAHLLWLEQGRAVVARSMMGDIPVGELANTMLQALAGYIGAQVGTLYRIEGQMLVPTGAFASELAAQNAPSIPLSQGVAGQVAKTAEVTVLHDVPPGYLRISSTLGGTEPRHVLVFPIFSDEGVTGIVELGFLRRESDFSGEIELVRLVATKFGLAVQSALYRQHLQELLEETRRQSEELQTQQEELRVSNEELQEQSRLLQESQSTLESQQNELEEANLMLAERSKVLERQKADLQAATDELARANRYKSEFLANMSHELRTPLNSSLILSHMLAENKLGNLTPDQVRHVKTIQSANQDLLALINDILDLSKIEAGQVELHNEPVDTADIVTSLRQMFEPIAAQRQIAFHTAAGKNAPALVTTDSQRLLQILKNLLSNAFKFTHSGHVRLDISAGNEGMVAFSVQDTGIGIARDKQEVIFEAFRQADGSTDRIYGGTGLGLSISRELAHLLGGRILLESEPGRGSTFTLEIPVSFKAQGVQERTGLPSLAVAASPAIPPRTFTPFGETKREAPAPAPSQEERPTVARLERQFERMILIVEDDEKFADVLCELVRDMHFDCLHAITAGAALRLAETHKPDAILLDVGLPDQSGLSVLAHLKRQPATRHIPVHIISVGDYQQTALELGAIGYAMKPAAKEQVVNAIRKMEERLERKVDRILIVEDDAGLRDSLSDMLKGENTLITLAASATEALQHLSESTFDCMVMDLGLPDQSGYELLEKMARSSKYSFPPVIVYTGRVLSRDEEQRLRQYAHSIIIKGAKSPERLLDEVSLFLHRVEASLPANQQHVLAQSRQWDAVFERRKILLVEDDVRNVFALTSLFEPLGAQLVIARNGKEALQCLSREENIDLVLMDLMMPEMDGLTAMREIRRQPQLRGLPIIALTAKAMANDRKESLDAGANDYIAKPIDVDKLISLCRIWMPK